MDRTVDSNFEDSLEEVWVDRAVIVGVVVVVVVVVSQELDELLVSELLELALDSVPLDSVPLDSVSEVDFVVNRVELSGGGMVMVVVVVVVSQSGGGGLWCFPLATKPGEPCSSTPPAISLAVVMAAMAANTTFRKSMFGGDKNAKKTKSKRRRMD